MNKIDKLIQDLLSEENVKTIAAAKKLSEFGIDDVIEVLIPLMKMTNLNLEIMLLLHLSI